MPSTTPRLQAAAQMHVSAPVRGGAGLMAPLSSWSRPCVCWSSSRSLQGSGS